MNKINSKTSEVSHGKYKIVCFTAGSQRFYQPRIKIKNGWWYSDKFFKTIIEAGDEARKVIYS